MADVLLVEDDGALAEGLTYALNLEKFTVSHARTLRQADEALQAQKFDIIILDVMLPDGSGLDFLVKIKKRYATPVLFLTACDQEYQIILGLDRGADDYITKPFRVRELISRIGVILRRTGTASSFRLVSGPLTLDTQSTELYLNGNPLPLTLMEYKLLLYFMKHPKQALTRARLLAGLWDNGGQFVDDNTLSVNIRRLREKIEENSASPQYITTVRGIGYMWNREVIGI
jgi:DNA-binding response OmpR family regulator